MIEAHTEPSAPADAQVVESTDDVSEKQAAPEDASANLQHMQSDWLSQIKSQMLTRSDDDDESTDD